MAETQTQEKDPVLDPLRGLLKEFESHKKRLALRRDELSALAEKGELTGKALADAVVELLSELHDTALSFQEDLARVCLVAFAEDDEDDEDEADDVIDDDELDSVLLPADAATINRSLSALESMVDGALQSAELTADDRKKLMAVKREGKNAFELVDSITLDDGDVDEGEEVPGDEEPAAGDEDTTN